MAHLRRIVPIGRKSPSLRQSGGRSSRCINQEAGQISGA
jgi:hypothetical protein